MISTGRETWLKRQIKSPLFIYTLRRPKACNLRILEQVPLREYRWFYNLSKKEEDFFASLIVFYYQIYHAWTYIYTEKKSLYSHLSSHTGEVFFRDFAINRPINFFCEIFGHLIIALNFFKFSHCRSSIYLHAN